MNAERRMMNEKHRPMTSSSFIIHRSSFFRRAFSFTEIMFAVIILGVGLIMVAAIFPVAIQQTRLNTEETTAAAMARGAMNYLGQAFADGAAPSSNPGTNTSNCIPQLTATGVVGACPVVQQPSDTYPTATGAATRLWRAARGNLILQQDPRYAWVFLWSRAGNPADVTTWRPYAQVYVFPVQASAAPTFTTDDLTKPADPLVANLMARPVRVAIANDVADAGGMDLIAFDVRSTVPADRRDNVAAAVEGAYVVIADDRFFNTPTGTAGRMNGRVYRLGARRTDLDNNTPTSILQLFGDASWSAPNSKVIYELQPGNDFTPDAGANGFISATNGSDDIHGIGNPNPIVVKGVTYAPRAQGTADAFLIGRGYRNPLNPAEGYEGGNMAIGFFTTFVQVN